MSYKKPTKAVITDAGFASRFLPITKTIPKAMLPLGAKPIMQHVVEECVAAGQQKNGAGGKLREVAAVVLWHIHGFPKSA